MSLSSHRRPPPRPQPPRRLSNPGPLWPALPADDRQRILTALSRLLGEHLQRHTVVREVAHE